MKKALSILLSVMMVAGLFVALIPTASAAASNKANLDATVKPPQYTLGEPWYTEDFEGVNSTLTGADLFAALGWDADGTKTFPSATLAIAKNEGENKWVSVKGSASVIPVLTDDRLAGGDYYIEYTQKMIANTNGNGQGLGVVSGGYGTSAVVTSASTTPYGNHNLIWQWNVKERGELDTIAYYPGYAKSEAAYCHSLDIAVPEDGGIAGNNNAPAAGSIQGEVIRFRIVVDADYGFSAYTLDENGNATLVACMASNTYIERWKANASSIADFFSFRILDGPTVLVDDIKVGSLVKEEKDNEPGLVISEFSTSGREAFIASDGKKHRFEWLEVYNAGTEPKNIYDYALLRRNGFMKYDTSTTGAVSSDALTNTITDSEWFSISYPEEEGGECIASRTNSTYVYKFTNPVYDKGVLQPGDTAILVNASDWWNGYYNADSLTASIDIFKSEYLKSAKLNYSDDQIASMKIFNCSAGKGTTSFGIDNEGYTLLGLAPLAEDGTCPAEGNHFYDEEYVENYVIDIKKKSGTSYNHAYLAGHLRYSYTPSEYYSQEYCSFDSKGNYLGTGLAVSGRNPGSSTHTLGYVLENQRRPFKVNYVVDDEVYKTELGYLKTDYTMTTSVPTKEGYTFVGWVDAQGNPATDIAAANMTKDVTYYANWKYTGPTATMIGTQSTYLYEDGTYDVRFVARIGAVEDITQIEYIHFEFSLAGEAITGSSSTFITKNIYLEYVYRTLSTDFGSDSLTEADGVYYVVLHLNKAPEDVIYKVKPVITLVDGTVNEGISESYTPVGLRQNIDYMHLSFDDGYKCFDNLAANDYDSLFDEPFFGWMKEMHDEYGAVFSVYSFNENLAAFAASENATKYQAEFQAAKDWLKIGLHSPANNQNINFSAEDKDTATDYSTTEAGFEEWTTMLTSVMTITGDKGCIDLFPRLHNFAGCENAINGMIAAGRKFAENTPDETDTAADYCPVGFLGADDTRISYYMDSTTSQWLFANDHITDSGKDLTFVATDIRAEYFATAPTKFTGADMYKELYIRHTVEEYKTTASSMIIFSHESRIQGGTDGVMESMELAAKFAKDFGIEFAFVQDRTYPSTEKDFATEPAPDYEPVYIPDSGSNEDVGVELPEIKV